MTPVDARTIALAALRRVLVDGQPPNGIAPADCAEHSAVVDAVYHGYNVGGVVGASKAAAAAAANAADPGAAALLNEVYAVDTAPWEAPIPLGDTAPPVPFPTEALPVWLEDFVVAEAEALQVPPDLPALLCLAVVAAAVQRRIVVCPRAGWYEPTSLYTVVSLPPAARKSPAFSTVVAPLEAYEVREAARLAPIIAEAQTDKKILEARLTTAQGAAAKAAPGDRGSTRDEAATIARELAQRTVPAVPRLVVDDATPEAIGTLLAEQGGRLAVLAAEGTIFEVIAGRYSDKPNLEVFLRGHAGDTHRVDRRTRTEYVQRAALTMGLTVQPDVLSGLAKVPGARGRGLLARFLFSCPTSTVGSRKIAPAPTPSHVKEAYHRQVTSLLEGIADPDDPHRVWFDVDADHALQAFEGEIEPQLAEGGTLGHIGDWAGKLAGLVARIAGLLHMAHYGPAGVTQRINAATVHRAIAIGRYATQHALHAFGLMGADPDMAAAQQVLRWLVRNGQPSVTRSDLFNGVRGGAGFKKASALDAPLGLLEDHNFIRPMAQPAKRSAGRPVQAYEVNPAALQHTNNPNNPNNPAYGASYSDYSDYSYEDLPDDPALEAGEGVPGEY